VALVRNRTRQPLWSSGQSSWLETQRPQVDSLRYQIFLEVVGLERGPPSGGRSVSSYILLGNNNKGKVVPVLNEVPGHGNVGGVEVYLHHS
jgi:hypothetical protein